MNKNLASVLKFLFFFSIGVFILWLVFKKHDITRIIEEIRKADYLWVSMAVAFGSLAHFSRALRWKILIKPLGHNPGNFSVFGAVMVGYLANLALPRAGEIARCGFLGKYTKIPVDSLIGTVLIERSVDFLMLLVLVIIWFFLQFKIFGSFFMDKLVNPMVDSAGSNLQSLIISVSIIIITIVILVFLFKHFAPKLKNNKWFYGVKKIIVGFITGLRTVKQMENPITFIGHTIFIWMMYFMMGYICFFSLDATSHLSPMVGYSVLMFASIGYSAPVPSGIGTYHWLLMEGLYLYGIPRDDGLTFATLTHSVQTFFIILLGGVFIFLLPIITKERKGKDEQI